jgi:cytochrome c553
LKTAILVLASCLIALLGVATANAADARVARDLSASCAACHGTEGRSVGKFAALAGQDAAKLVESLEAFRDGTRTASVMHQHAKGYTDEEFALIADFYSRQSATGR